MYRKNTSSWLKHLDFLLLDIICLQAAFTLGYWLRHGMLLPYANEFYKEIAVVFVLLDLAAVFFLESYKGILRRGMYREFLETLKHVSLVILLMSAYLYMVKRGEEFSRLTFGYTWAIWFILAYVARMLLKNYLQKRIVKKSVGRSLLVLTSSDRAERILQQMKESQYEGITVSGIALVDVDYETLEDKWIAGVPVIEYGETIMEYISRRWVDEIFVDISKKYPLPTKFLEDCVSAGVTVHMTLNKLMQIPAQKQTVDKVAGYTVLTSSINMATPRQLLAKRLLDILGGLVGCILTAILFVFVAPAIYIASPGPFFFSQIRVGKNGRQFKIYKFRSMYMDAEERKKDLLEKNNVKDGMMFKMDEDPRIIKGIGQFIRDYSIDEFPQFWNVLKGEMSLVGTRPPTLDEWDKYELHHRARMSTKPGITGLWQVSGRSKITDFEEVVKLDTKYISEWSFGKDLKILLQTVGVVLAKDGAK